jgi:hypothetical protein
LKKEYLTGRVVSWAAAFLLAVVAGCVTQGAEDTLEDSVSGTLRSTPQTEEAAPEEAEAEEDESLVRMAEFLENGLERIFQGSISEGIQQLISVLAESEAQTRPSADALEIAARAETELVKLGAAIAMESDSIWVDGKGNQIKGSLILSKEVGPLHRW